MNLLEFAKSELERLENSCGEDAEALNMQKIVTQDVMQIIQTFVEQQHSGFSAGYMLNILERLLRYKPLSPIEDKPEDWEDCSKLGMNDLQHKRCSSVFKRPDGTAYWVEGKIFTDDGGKSWYTSKDSIVDITFPFNVPLHSENVYITKNIKEESGNENN